MIKVDEREFQVDVTEVGLDVEFVYKYAERAENYEMQYELGAMYYNQSLTFRILSTRSSIDKGTGHAVELRTPLGNLIFMMYPNKLSVKLLHCDPGGETWWSGFTVTFIALKPVERW